MCQHSKGPKGAMGLPGGVGTPDHIVEIVDFRNQNLDSEHEYKTDKVDEAINELFRRQRLAEEIKDLFSDSIGGAAAVSELDLEIYEKLTQLCKK